MMVDCCCCNLMLMTIEVRGCKSFRGAEIELGTEQKSRVLSILITFDSHALLLVGILWDTGTEVSSSNHRSQWKKSAPYFIWISATHPRPNYVLSAMIELTMSLSFSRSALMAFFRDTLAWVMTRSISLASKPFSSTSSPSSSSSSSFLASAASTALPLPFGPWSCPAWASPLPA